MRTIEDFRDVYNLDNNLKTLAMKLTNDFIDHNDILLGLQQHKWFNNILIKLKYPNREFDLLLFNNLYLLGYYDESLLELNEQLKQKECYINPSDLVKHLINFSFKINKKSLNSFHIYRLSWNNKSTLTKFGINNLPSILEVLDIILNEKFENGFFNDFFIFNDKGKIVGTHPPENYYNYYKIGKDSDLKKKEDILRVYKKPDGTATLKSVENAIFFECSNLMREAENLLRISIGAKKIGEGHISETELFYKLKMHFKEYEVIQHGRPEFLGRQHFDVWIPQLNIAIEYQGAQHDKPIDYFGGIDAFIKNQERDELKKIKCIQNNIILIEVRPEYSLTELIIQIESIIK